VLAEVGEDNLEAARKALSAHASLGGEALLRALIGDAGGRYGSQQLRTILSRSGLARDQVSQVLGVRDQGPRAPLASDLVSWGVRALITPAEDGLVPAAAGRALAQARDRVRVQVQKLLATTPLTQEGLVVMWSGAPVSSTLAEKDVRHLMAQQRVSEEVVSEFGRALSSTNAEMIAQARERCFEKVRLSNYPNPISRAWHEKARAAALELTADERRTLEGELDEDHLHVLRVLLGMRDGEAGQLPGTVEQIREVMERASEVHIAGSGMWQGTPVGQS